MDCSNNLLNNSDIDVANKIQTFIKNKNETNETSDNTKAIELFVECVNGFYQNNKPLSLIQSTITLLSHIENIVPSLQHDDISRFIQGFIKWIEYDSGIEIRTTQDYRTQFEYSLLNRNMFSALFNILDSLKKVERMEFERMFFTTYVETIKMSSAKLKSVIDYEEKISLMELYWRGLRRVDINGIKDQKSFKIPIKEISRIKPKHFEFECQRLLIKYKCLCDKNGYFERKGIIEILNGTDGLISNHKLKELNLSNSSFRIHIDSDDGTYDKIEVPYHHINEIKICKLTISFSFSIILMNFNITWLWSESLKQDVNGVEDNLIRIKLTFTTDIPKQMLSMIRRILQTLNGDRDKKIKKDQNSKQIEPEITTIRDENDMGEILFISNSQDREINELLNDDRDEYNKSAEVGENLFEIVSKRSEEQDSDKSLFTQESFVENMDVRGSWIEPFSNIGMDSVLKCNIPKSMDISKENKAFVVNDCEIECVKISEPSPNYYETTPSSLNDSNKSTITLSSEISELNSFPIDEFEEKTLYQDKSHEPLMESIKRYRERKSEEMLNRVKREYKQECEQGKILIKKLCQDQFKRRKSVDENFKIIISKISSEIEKENNNLISEGVKILKDLEILKNKYTFNEKIADNEKCGNILIENSIEIVKKTDETLRDMENKIEKIKKHYERKIEDCEKALKSIYIK